MDTKQLRLLAGEMVVFSNLSKQAKNQMLEFIRHEATDTQLKALLLDGRIVYLDEQAEEIVNDRFNLLEIEPLVGAYIVGLLTPAIVKGATYMYKNYISKAGQACRDFEGKEKALCLRKYKLRGKIKALKTLYDKCSQSDNPEKCKAKLKERIRAANDTLRGMTA